ncbi:MAG: hypothetical protein GWO23_10105 [Gammaproteobacteria bacterium]|nr:hypothetical protein [Gammaproteobacteria bacterium]NIS51238.1 hypothetical protein [Phycisphaerae bacterium]NIW45041.1 hypothetical protein [Gammaproteobacteria bacterium]NIW98536.1 hypothetical protein [Phycisphaerae bacterium]
MAEQLQYDSERQTKDTPVSMPRGDDRHLVFEHVLGPSTAVKEARFHVVDPDDDTVVIALALDAQPTQWDFTTTDNEGEIWIKSADTVGVTVKSYNYAIELIDQSDLVYTPQRGSFELTDDVVTNTGSAPYLSWSTRETLEAEIDTLEGEISQLATCGDCTYLTVAVTGGEGTITVADSTNMTGKNIRVMLDSGYEDETVSSVSGNVLTLAGTVAGAASVRNYVRIL